MIHEWLEFIELPGATRRVVFLPDYDLRVAEQPIQGVDVWINAPRLVSRHPEAVVPLEAPEILWQR